MWEQYGDTHRGAVLVFRREALEAALSVALHAKGLHYLREVAYTPGGVASSKARWVDDLGSLRPDAFGSSSKRITRSCSF